MSFLSPIHIAFFAAVALLVLGPKRFPEFTRSLGHSMREFREVLNGMPRREDLASAAPAQADPVAGMAADPAVAPAPAAPPPPPETPPAP